MDAAFNPNEDRRNDGNNNPDPGKTSGPLPDLSGASLPQAGAPARAYPIIIKDIAALLEGETDQTFMELKIGSPALTDYLVELQTNFLRTENIFTTRAPDNRRFKSMGEIIGAADEAEDKSIKIIRMQQAGDIGLFISSSPEKIKLLNMEGMDRYLNPVLIGKDSYRRIAILEQDENPKKAEVFFELSSRFAAISYSLGQVYRNLKVA